MQPEQEERRERRQQQGLDIEACQLGRPKPHWTVPDSGDAAEQDMQREPEAQVQDHADHCGGDAGKRSGKARVCAQALDIGRANEDPEEAGREGRPQRDGSAEQAESERRLATFAEAGKEAHELGHQNEGPGVVSASPSPSSISPALNQP